MLDELRYGIRSLGRVPSLTAISILTVALGIGAGTSLFSVVKAVLLNPLPYPQADRLVWLTEASGRFRNRAVSFPDFDDFRSQSRSFSVMAAFSTETATVGDNVPEKAEMVAASEEFFNVLGVRPAVGRTFSQAEQLAAKPSVVILSHGLWQRIYGGDRRILGRTIQLNGVPVTVIGIMPPRFAFPDQTEGWVPLYQRSSARTAHNYRAIGRLRPGVTIEQAQADVSGIARRLKRQYPNPFQNEDASIVSLYSHIVGEVRPALLILFAAVGFLLLIVCVNVANLLLVRVSARARELAIRAAVGAGRWRLLRLTLGESLLLALAGGASGCALAGWSIDLLRILLPASIPRVAEIRMDFGVFVFAFAVSAATGLVFGALPAWRASHSDPNEGLRAGSRSYTAGVRSQRTQGALVISEVALALVLVAGAGLLMQSFWRLRAVNPGFNPDHVLAATLTFPVVDEDHGLIAKYRELFHQVRTIPGTQGAAIAVDPPLSRYSRDGNFVIENRREVKNADAQYSVVTPGYFETLRIPLLRGRDFTDADSERAPGVAIINAEMARVYFPGTDPIGQRIWFPSFEPDEPLWLTIIGIAPDVRQRDLIAPVQPQAYVCYAQIRHPGILEDATLVLRGAVDPAGLAPPIRNRLRDIDRGAAVVFRSMDSILADATARQRFQMQVLAAFAILALLLAAIGLYGVLSYAVTRSRNEIGIRLALGAQPAAVFRMVTGRALRLALFGVAFGLAGWVAVHRLLNVLLFGVTAGNAASLAGATALLLLITLLASWFPARRATRIDPASALREE